jgi:Family of unknown function (DUF6318)
VRNAFQLTALKKSPAAPLAVLLASSLLLAGCGDSTKPSPAPSSTPASSPSTTAAPTPSASPTPAKATTDPNIPAAARAHTPAGAEAFVRYFYSQLNIAWSEPKAGLILSLSAKTCKTCAAFEGSAVDLASKHHHYRGEVFDVATVASVGDSEILVAGEQPPGAVIDSAGTVVKRKIKAQKGKFVVAVEWSSGGWRVNEIKVLK